MIASGQRNNTNALHRRPDCEKQDHLESSASPCYTCYTVTVFRYQQCISCLHVVIKKIYNFPKKSELPTFILPVAYFFCSFQGGNEKFAEIRAGSISHLAALQLSFALTATLRVLVLQFSPVLQCEPARRLVNPLTPKGSPFDE